MDAIYGVVTNSLCLEQWCFFTFFSLLSPKKPF